MIDSSCFLREAVSAEEVEYILKDPEIFARISEDGITPEEYSTPFDGNQCYMMVYVGDEPVGVWRLHPLNSTTLMIHCNILKDYREYAAEAGRLIVEWFAKESPEQYNKLNAEIPVIYPDVYHFTKKFGFQDEGINRDSIKKNGEIVSQWQLGLTRDEALRWVA